MESTQPSEIKSVVTCIIAGEASCSTCGKQILIGHECVKYKSGDLRHACCLLEKCRALEDAAATTASLLKIAAATLAECGFTGTVKLIKLASANLKAALHYTVKEKNE